MPRAAEIEQIDVPQVESRYSDLIERAYAFRAEKEALFLKINANRRSLRDLAAQDVLTNDEVVWLGQFYPLKTRGAAVEL